MELFLFGLVALVAIAAAIGMLLSKNAVHSALFLIVNFACVAFLFLMLDAPFISMVQIAVYAGAIMVLFLFVIMLLGAEKTTDTTRTFRWLTGTALVLGLVFLAIVGLPLISNQFVLPESDGDSDPMIRVSHAATDVPAVNITIESADETLEVDNVVFGDVTDFMALAPGDYTLTISLVEPDVQVSSDTISLNDDEAITAVAIGSPREGTFELVQIQEDLSPVANDGSRIVVFNAYSTEPVSLVDLGANEVVDLRNRTVIQEDGSELTESQIGDEVLAEDLAYGDWTIVEVQPGDYDLAFVTAARNDLGLDVVVVREVDAQLGEGVAQVMVLTGEPPALADEPVRPFALALASMAVPSFGSPKAIGQVLFTDYLLPVQVVGVLLLVALIGVVALTRTEPSRRVGVVRRRKVSRPLVNVIASQTGSAVFEERPQLDAPTTQPEASGD